MVLSRGVGLESSAPSTAPMAGEVLAVARSGRDGIKAIEAAWRGGVARRPDGRRGPGRRAGLDELDGESIDSAAASLTPA
ncbi:hypothetical protein ACU4GD_23400 [Cupriavidus basilensis]